jgi:HEAT repeat protein
MTRGLLLLCLLALAGCGQSESQRLIQRLRSRNIAIRLQAIAQAEAHPDTRVRDELLRLFDDEREVPIVRGCAGIALGQLHDERMLPRALKRLPAAIVAKGLSRTKPNLDPYLLGKAILAYGPESLPSLASLLKDSRKEVVAWTLIQYGLYRGNDQALEVLCRYLGDREVVFRRAAAFGLTEIFHRGAEDPILKHLNDGDSQVRYNLAWALSNCGSTKALPAAEAQLAREPDPKVKEELAKAVAVLKSRRRPAGIQTQPLSGLGGVREDAGTRPV